MTQTLFIYGPPGSGKTTLGKLLAGRFGVPFEDLDGSIVRAAAGKSIPEIFADEGEPGFRARERAA
ncbi:MAG: AAA family ATPase, partial [Kiritimatiellae bacterium]|nr:AAA family ATPase [Kiritimatiellia bacterium]